MVATSYMLSNCKIYYGSYDLSGDHNGLNMSPEAVELDTTGFGATARDYVSGLTKVNWDLAGLWQGGDTGVDKIHFDQLGAARVPVTVGPLTGAAGEVSYLFRASNCKYAPGGGIGDIFKFSVTGSGTGPLVRATVMENGSKASTATGTARQVGAATAAQTIYAIMHVIAVSGTSPTLDMVIQSDDAEAFLDPTARITFTQATAITSEWKTLAGAVADTWWRCSWTVGGTNTPTFAVVVSLGIK